VLELIAPALGKDPKDLKVYIEHEDSIYGTTLAERQKELLEEAGVQVVGVGAHSAKAIDLTDSILRAQNAAPDVWMQTGYVPDGNLLLKTARDQGFKPSAILLVGTGDTPETLEAFGPEALDGILVVGYPRPDIAPAYGPGAADFLKAYQTKYSRDPIAPQSMSAFVGCKIMAEAINAAGSTEMDAVRNAAAAIDKPEGSYETGFGVKFDEKMQNTRAFPTIVQWQGGKLVTVYPKAAAAQDTQLVDLARP
jgi:branched-chain amino acid transport system substrate-binding protein